MKHENRNKMWLPGTRISGPINFMPQFEVAKYQILQRNELDLAPPEEYFGVNDPAYLYCVLSKNKIKINKDFITFDDHRIYLEFIIKNQDQDLKEKVFIDHTYQDLKTLKIESKFPYNKFFVIDELGNKLIGEKTAYFLENDLIYNQISNKSLLNYEILYIGQSVTEGNFVPALSRTLKHETIQKIQDEYLLEHEDKELFTMLFSFKKRNYLDFPEHITDKDRADFAEKFVPYWYTPTITQVEHTVNLVEASLINFFKPRFNDKFVKNAPSKYHDSFKALHDLNMSKTLFYFGLEGLNPIFFSKAINRRKDSYEIQYEF